ncbi:branched-chain amino acid transport system substrate-binding protein [Bradyrhizobium sp. USDA 4461]
MPVNKSAVPTKIGAIFMFSGGVAELGQDSFDGADAALHFINSRDASSRKFEWVKADGSSPEEAAQQAERMITQDGVRTIVGCYGSNHSIEVSKVCEKYGAVLWTQTAWTASLFDHKPKYTFRTNTYATPVEEAAVDYVLHEVTPLLAKKSDLRVMVINEGSAYGVSCGDETVKALTAKNIKPIQRYTYDARYDGADLDFDNIVSRIKEQNPDVLFASSFIRDSVGILDAMKRAGYRPPVIMTSSAGFGLYTLNLAGEMTEGILSANAPALVAPAALNETGRRLQVEYVSRLKGLTGRQPSGFNAMSFCAAYSLLNDVIPKIQGEMTAESIRHAAMSRDIPLGTYPNGWGLKFDAVGQNERCPVSIDQWQKGSLNTIWPRQMATSIVNGLPLPPVQ